MSIVIGHLDPACLLFFLQPTEAYGFNKLFEQYSSVICRPSDHTVGRPHRIINDRMEKHGSLFVFISKKHCRAAFKNLLADGRGG